MDAPFTVDLSQVASQLRIEDAKVKRAVELLDEGNTVPFITRFRKDQTGGLDEEQIRLIEQHVKKLRALEERKQRVLKVVEAQDLLTPELAEQIKKAQTIRRVDDLYLPFRAKKQTLATIARKRGLEPLAKAILAGEGESLDALASAYVNEEHELGSVQDVLQSVQHIIAEEYYERVEVRDALRKLMHEAGQLVSSRIEGARPDAPEAETETETETEAEAEGPEVAEAADDAIGADSAVEAADADASSAEGATAGDAPTAEPVATEPPVAEPVPEPPVASETPAADSAELGTAEAAPSEEASPVSQESENPTTIERGSDPQPASEDASDAPATDATPGEATETTVQTADLSAEATATDVDASGADAETPAAGVTETTDAATTETGAPSEAAAPAEQAPPSNAAPANKSGKGGKGKGKNKGKEDPAAKAAAKKALKEKKRQKKISAFKDYFEFQEALNQVPPHRILAINRGERARILRVKVQVDQDKVGNRAAQLVLSDDHVHGEYLKGCLRDALVRLLLPSLERELRRELTERAETHAVEVFARNLRKLLLQPPVRGRNVLAIDPGFKSGCKVAALDQFGRLLGSATLHLVGSGQRRQRGRKTLIDMIRKHKIGVVAIGNGTACRETEQLVAGVFGDELKDMDLAYVVTNEAGASVYSTSQIGREELPEADPILRSAISIGRRLLDPLSELVKINPANIGVGMYQHDVKSKHLRESLDAVVESCVNFVGVDVNTASPALLRYVSGLNQLTARRVFEHRQANGPFQNREQLREVPGFGDSSYIQAAGFLKVTGSENPLDATAIHPESYETAQRVLEHLEGSEDDLRYRVRTTVTVPPLDPPPAKNASEPAPTPAPAEPVATEPVGEAGAASEDAATATPETPAAGSEAPVADPETPELANAEEAANSTGESAVTEPGSATDEAVSPAADAENVSESTDASSADAATADMTAEELAERQSRCEQLVQRVACVDVDQVSQRLQIGRMLLQDILAAIVRPGRDPRDDFPPPPLRTGIVKLEDLEVGMELSGTVLNVVDFGAFVDIGLSDSGLIHISRLADQYVRDPHEVVSVGDTLRVWVVEVDKNRRRVSLTAIEPGTEKERPPKRPARQERSGSSEKRPPRGDKRPRRQDRSRGGAGKGKTTMPPRKPAKPKPVKPITKEMVDGTEPMRSFSDLAQFFQSSKPKPDESQE